MIDHTEPLGRSAEAATALPEDQMDAQLRELMPRALRGDLAAIDRVLDILEQRRRGRREEWMRWVWQGGEDGRRAGLSGEAD